MQLKGEIRAVIISSSLKVVAVICPVIEPFTGESSSSRRWNNLYEAIPENQ